MTTTTTSPVSAPPAPTLAAPDASRTWAEQKVAALLAQADVRINGDRPWDITVRDPRLYRRLLMDGLVGLGDAYVDGWWECAALDQFFERCLRADLPARIRFDRHVLWECLKQRVLNLQKPAGAWRNGQHHYDRGNDIFAATLDSRLVYTCGYWAGGATTLEAAQEAKLDLVCRKVGLREGDRVLDLGCGWGSFAQFAAERYGAHVVGVTVSHEQVKLARERCAGLPVEIRLQDYREVPAADGPASYDHVVSIGMFEHVGPKNYRTCMEVVSRVLRDDGLFLMHAFAARRSFPNTIDGEVAWINRNIFPGLVCPSMAQLGAALDGIFVVEDVENFGADYDPTLMAWTANFERNWPPLAAKYGERFYRTWKYYLLSAAGAFRCRKYQLWHFVLSKHGVPGGYHRPR